MASTVIVLVLQAALLLVLAAVSPPAACPSGSIVEYQSVLTWHKSSAQSIKKYPQNSRLLIVLVPHCLEDTVVKVSKVSFVICFY